MEKPIAVKLFEALLRGGPTAAIDTEDRELQALADDIQIFVNQYHRLDMPFVAAAMRLAADALKASLSPSGQNLADSIMNGVGCALIVNEMGGYNGKEQ